jgi:hypothetical protein
MLEKDPVNRPLADEILKDPFFLNYGAAISKKKAGF